MHTFISRLANQGPRLLPRLAGILMIGSLALAACSSAPSSASATATGAVPQTGATSASTSMATSAATGTTAAAGAATSGATMSASGTPAATSSSSYGTGGSTASATGAATSAAASSNAPASVALTVKSGSVGQYLADDKGMTLYIWKKDAPGVSNCAGQCAGIWPPLLVAKGGQVTLSGGGTSSKLGTITRSDGTTQVTYNNQPLYHYVKDKAPGDTTGQGVGGAWFVAQP